MDEETIEQLRALMRLAREQGLSELTVESADGRVSLRRGGGPVRGSARLRPVSSAGTRAEEIKAPLPGVFYRSPAPDAPSYVEVGDWVQNGQIVALIEAMKVFNEIASEIEGRVAAITAQSGELVQAGQVLMVIELEA